MTDSDKIQRFIQLIQTAKEKDESLRKQYGVEKKFKFIDEQLHACLSQLESQLKTWQDSQSPALPTSLSDQETIVYVHLFNAQGIHLSTWAPMLSAGVFYEHSINRPVYENENDVQKFIRSKKNSPQHAYFSIIIEKRFIQEKSDFFDALGQPLIKVKEGSFQREKLRHFFHSEQYYELIKNELHKLESTSKP